MLGKLFFLLFTSGDFSEQKAKMLITKNFRKSDEQYPHIPKKNKQKPPNPPLIFAWIQIMVSIKIKSIF